MRALFLVAVVSGSSACAYDRDIGPVPYLCAPSEPRCPDDYACEMDPSSGRDICVGPGGNPNGFDCTDDSAIEPNNMVESATPTPLDAMKSFEKDGAICPTGDKDIFKVTIAAANQRLEVLVESEAGGAMLNASILNRGGGAIAIGAPVSGMPTLHRAVFDDLPVGDFFAQVAGPTTGALPVNNYHLKLTLTASSTFTSR